MEAQSSGALPDSHPADSADIWPLEAHEHRQQRRAQALLRARMDARHGCPPVCQELLDDYCFGRDVTAAEIRAAEAEGRRMRAAGIRCMCPRCEVPETAVASNETLRCNYARRRHAELSAAGMADPEKRAAHIQHEIDSGAALQSAPVRVIRTGGAA